MNYWDNIGTIILPYFTNASKQRTDATSKPNKCVYMVDLKIIIDLIKPYLRRRKEYLADNSLIYIALLPTLATFQ